MSRRTGKRNKRAAGDIDPDIDPDEEITDENLQAYPEFRQDNLFTPINVSVKSNLFLFKIKIFRAIAQI